MHFIFSIRSRGWSTWAPRCAARWWRAPLTPASTCRGCYWCPGWPLAAPWGQLRDMYWAPRETIWPCRNYLWQEPRGELSKTHKERSTSTDRLKLCTMYLGGNDILTFDIIIKLSRYWSLFTSPCLKSESRRSPRTCGVGWLWPCPTTTPTKILLELGLKKIKELKVI